MVLVVGVKKEELVDVESWSEAADAATATHDVAQRKKVVDSRTLVIFQVF